jgi:phosphate starvation-inducible PhoH-like protein
VGTLAEVLSAVVTRESMFESTISVVDVKSLLPLFGTRDQHLRKICDSLGVRISAADHQIQVRGEKQAVAHATEVLERMQATIHLKGSIASDEVARLLSSVTGSWDESHLALEVYSPSEPIKPRTAGQAEYVRAIRGNPLVFADGPAGTGKTYLAVAAAVESLKREVVRKIVLVRPAVEAGESLGFLPGDLQAKINPYLRPLFDALHVMVDAEQLKRFTSQDIIEVVPLAYMRGRTLNASFAILDEAQNTTINQMKMFLTRLGEGSVAVVCGDSSQVDLPGHTRSGLLDAKQRLQQIPGFAQVELTSSDIVRSRLVRDILRAYERSHGRQHEENTPAR